MHLTANFNSPRLIFAALLLASMSLPSMAADKNPYDGMNLSQFIQHVGKRLDLTIAIGERVRGNRPILIYVDEKLPKDELFETFQTMLQMQDYVAIEHKGIVRIVRDRQARSSPVPVIGP